MWAEPVLALEFWIAHTFLISFQKFFSEFWNLKLKKRTSRCHLNADETVYYPELRDDTDWIFQLLGIPEKPSEVKKKPGEVKKNF